MNNLKKTSYGSARHQLPLAYMAIIRKVQSRFGCSTPLWKEEESLYNSTKGYVYGPTQWGISSSIKKLWWG